MASAVCVLALLATAVAEAQTVGGNADGAPLIKEIRIVGAQRTQEYILLRELQSRVGDPFRPELLQVEHDRLERLDIFAEIEVSVLEEGDGVVLRIKVRETFPWLPSISVTITDENGVSAGPTIKNNNFLGRNILVGGRLQFGGTKNLEALISNPWFAGNHLSYRVQLVHRERDNSNVGFFETANEIDLRLQTWLGQDGRAGGRLTFRDIGSDVDGVTLDPDNRDQVFELAAFLVIDNRDLVSDTNNGWWSELEVRRSGAPSVGDSGHWQVTLDGRRYFSLADRHTLALFSMARLRSGEIGEAVAPWQLFFIGGRPPATTRGLWCVHRCTITSGHIPSGPARAALPHRAASRRER